MFKNFNRNKSIISNLENKTKCCYNSINWDNHKHEYNQTYRNDIQEMERSIINFAKERNYKTTKNERNLLENSFEYFNPKNVMNIKSSREPQFQENTIKNNNLLNSLNLDSSNLNLQQKLENLNINAPCNFHSSSYIINEISIEKAYTFNNETWILVTDKSIGISEHPNNQFKNLPILHWINLNLFDMNKLDLKSFKKEYL